MVVRNRKVAAGQLGVAAVEPPLVLVDRQVAANEPVPGSLGKLGQRVANHPALLAGIEPGGLADQHLAVLEHVRLAGGLDGTLPLPIPDRRGLHHRARAIGHRVAPQVHILVRSLDRGGVGPVLGDLVALEVEQLQHDRIGRLE